MKDEAPPMMLATFLKYLDDRYGKVAFGIATVLLLWHFVVVPSQRSSEQQSVLFVQASENMKATATILKTAVDTLTLERHK